MTQDVTLFQQGGDLAISAKFAGMVDEIGGDLSGGVQGSYAILAIKGSRFALKYQGTTTPITNAETGDPVGSFEAVLVKSNPFLTKQFYESGYTEGDSAAPDCFSLNGKTPDPSSPKLQHTTCAACPQNAFTKINEKTGKKTKACQDNRKMAILPADDLVNELFGGPMLLRIPAASLKDLAMFGDTLKARGYSYNSVRVRIGFDLTVSYPKLVFKAIRPLTDDEADQVLEWYHSDNVNKMLADFEDIKVPVVEQAQPVEDEVFEQPQPVKVAAKPVPPVVKPAPVQAKAAPQAPAAPPATAAKPAGVSFGKPAAAKTAAPAATATAPKAVVKKAAPAPAPVVEPEPADTTTEQVPGNLENDIAGILSELSSIAGE